MIRLTPRERHTLALLEIDHSVADVAFIFGVKVKVVMDWLDNVERKTRKATGRLH